MKHTAPWRAALLCGLLLCLALLTACGGSSAKAETAGSCTVSISCAAILDNLDQLKAAKADYMPADGVILPETEVSFAEGETAFDLLQRVCRDNGISMESSWSPLYKSAYIEGIANLYEFDCGKLSGWMYSVNGEFPNVGASAYTLCDGDVVKWEYTCDLGRDLGADFGSESAA